MKDTLKHRWLLLLVAALSVSLPRCSRAEVRAWEGTITIPTYPWQDDVNPRFWALEGAPGLSTTAKGSITYPYTMQDHLWRTKTDRTYKALFVENEYLKVVCLPELGGRIHSVLDKTEGEEMFHLNRVIKPGMIAMRGAWVSGGIEWNSGPHGHTVTCVSPVDGLVGRNADGSAFLEVSNLEKIFRTRWSVRITLHPGKAYLDERIRISNATDAMHPYYFWNCTAFPNRPGTRFIYPMTLGTDHNGTEFFTWPVHEGKDLTWLKNYERSASVFAVDCSYDFFGAYDVDDDRGIVQVANHHVLPGKKAWTWGNWDFGLVSQQNLTDEDGPYIEVQSGPLPTQSDYGMLAPREEVAWQEWWYPVHGLGDGFEYAGRDLAVQTARSGGTLTLRVLATGRFPGATCTLGRGSRMLKSETVDLSPQNPCTVTLSTAGDSPVDVTVKTKERAVLAAFTTPLPIPKVVPPEASRFEEKPDDRLSVEETYFKGFKFDRDTNRPKAREYYEKALAEDPGHAPSLRALAVLDFEAGLFEKAAGRLKKALARDPDDGLCWYFLGACHLRLGDTQDALADGYRAAGCSGTASLGYDLVGRAQIRLGARAEAVDAFAEAVRMNPNDTRADDHLLLALYATGQTHQARQRAENRIARHPTDLVPRAVLALEGKTAMQRFVGQARALLGEDEFELLETAVVFAELGLLEESGKLLRAACVDALPPAERSPLPLYYLAYYASLQADEKTAREYLRQAAAMDKDFVFASRTEAVPVLQYAVEENSGDGRAQLHLGNLLGNLGRFDEAISHWEKAAGADPSLSMAFRNLGLAALARQSDPAKAAALYTKAVAARPDDQTLYRDLAEILIADSKRTRAIGVLQSMPFDRIRRADVIILLARAYQDEERYSDTIDLLAATPYFVNWEGQDVTWGLFNSAHSKRGQARFEEGDFLAALEDFEAALTYPENLGVGRSDQPQEAPAQYWRGKALEALGRLAEARQAWKEGAAGSPGSDEQNEHRQLCKEALARTR